MKSALITGASSGFGMNVALALAEAGWRVFASFRNPDRGEPLRAAIKERGLGDRVELVTMDVTDMASVDCGVASVLNATGGAIDALLNNAGYSILGAFEDYSDADCRQQMETNFYGVLAVTRAVLPAMRAASKGRIVIVTSNSVNTPHPMLTMYAASKWALEGWAEGLAMEVAPFGIQVVVVQPGAHRTPFAEHVVPVVPAGSPYAEWMATAMPGIANLDAWGRDPHRATGPIVRALTEPDIAFRHAVGEDTVVFSALKGLFPYEIRAWAMRAIVGLPEINQFAPSETSDVSTRSVLNQVIEKLVAAAIKSPDGFGTGVLDAIISNSKSNKVGTREEA